MNIPAKQPVIAFIGAGTMAEAMIAGLLREGITVPAALRASAPRQERGHFLREKYGLQAFTDNRQACQDADLVVLSVKPQRLEAVLSDLKGCLPAETLALSIVAGATIEKISKGLRHKAVVRAMPNTPARIGAGITVWTDSATVSSAQRDLARRLLAALGEEIYVDEENYLDMATALSGTGPAYVYLFMEAMIDAGVHMGFPRRIAEQLVTETLLGSVQFYKQQAATHVAALRNQVTSPGGTSAEALYYLEKASLRTAISRAIWAAYQRSLELGRAENDIHIPHDPD